MVANSITVNAVLKRDAVKGEIVPITISDAELNYRVGGGGSHRGRRNQTSESLEEEIKERKLRGKG